MALITSCQATFQNFSGYEDDLSSLEENIRECYSEITKTSEQINMSVREEFISRSELETIQKDFETSIPGLRAIGDGASVTRGLQQASANGLSVARSILKTME